MTEDEMKAMHVRGHILHAISLLESEINLYISTYFCGDDTHRQVDMQLLLLGDDRITLNNKAQVFHYIASNYDKQWYKDYKSVGNSMNADLVKVIEERNVFAHRIFDHANTEIFSKKQEGTLRFIRMKNKPEPLDYSDDDIDRICKMIQDLTEYIYYRLTPSKSDESTLPPSAE